MPRLNGRIAALENQVAQAEAPASFVVHVPWRVWERPEEEREAVFAAAIQGHRAATRYAGGVVVVPERMTAEEWVGRCTRNLA